MLVSAAMYGFLLTPKNSGQADGHVYYLLAWYLPPVFIFLAMLRWRESTYMIANLAKYIRGIERL
jgi:hypothetical protein